MQFANQITGSIVSYNQLPEKWIDRYTGKEINFFQFSTEEKYNEQGFYPRVYPPINNSTEYYGTIYWDEPTSTFTYPVELYTEEELQDKALKESKAQQTILVNNDLTLGVLASAQGYTDDEALNNKALYPQWQYPVDYPLDFKVQDFVGAELKLYKSLQAHTSQVDWKPSLTPAIWLEIAPPGVIPVWVQPTGAHDAYNTGQQVHYPTETDPIYESTIDANIYAPGVVAGQWVEVI